MSLRPVLLGAVPSFLLAMGLVATSGCAKSKDEQGEQTLSPTSAGEADPCARRGGCPPECWADRDCPDDERCDQEGGGCVADNAPVPSINPEPPAEDPETPPSQECIAAAECGEGFECADGVCQPLDEDSFLEQVADQVVATCDESSDCGLLQTCEFGVCFGCLLDLQCANGQTCIRGFCVEEVAAAPIECLSADCPEGMTCLWNTGECVPSCADEPCDDGLSCVPGLSVCAAEFGCQGDLECVGSAFCVEGVCVGCSDDADCRDGESCQASVCLPDLEGIGTAPACIGNSCGESELCDPVDGSCYPENGTCSSDDHCRGERGCNFLGLCECGSNDDCRSDQTCLLGACAPLDL